MPTISGSTVVPAGQSVANLVLGSQYELAPADGTIEIGMRSSRALTTCSIYSGPDVLQEPGGIVPYATELAAGTASYPKYPDDYHWEDEVARGDRLKITVINGDGANAVTINWVLRFTPA